MSRAAPAACPEAPAALATGALALALAFSGAAVAQTLDVGRPRTLVVGTPGGARTARVDGARTGRSRDPLPASSLRVQWQTPTGAPLDGIPVVDASRTAYVVGARGEVVAVDRDGGERWRVSTGAVQPGPAALLSDDTLVFADALGEAVAVRNGAVRWRVRFGRGDASHPAPLALEDGGVIVATAHDLAALDVDGQTRARTTLPEAAAGPLVAANVNGGPRVVAIGSSGTAWSWAPGAAEPDRAGSFGGPIEGGAVLENARTLVAVTSGGTQFTALDLVRGTATTRMQAQSGALWLGPPAALAGSLFLTLLAPTAELLVAVDSTGTETLRVHLVSRAPLFAADGGVSPVVSLPHAAPLVDASGTVAFASTDGTIGTATAAGGDGGGSGTVELLTGACSGARMTGGASDPGRVTGLAPLAPGVFIAACHGGMLVAIGSAPPGPGGPGAGPL